MATDGNRITAIVAAVSKWLKSKAKARAEYADAARLRREVGRKVINKIARRQGITPKEVEVYRDSLGNPVVVYASPDDEKREAKDDYLDNSVAAVYASVWDDEEVEAKDTEAGEGIPIDDESFGRGVDSITESLNWALDRLGPPPTPLAPWAPDSEPLPIGGRS